MACVLTGAMPDTQLTLIVKFGTAKYIFNATSEGQEVCVFTKQVRREAADWRML